MKHSLIQLYIKWKNLLKDGKFSSFEDFFSNYENQQKSYFRTHDNLKKSKSISFQTLKYIENLVILFIVSSPIILINYIVEMTSFYNIFIAQLILSSFAHIFIQTSEYLKNKQNFEKNRNFLEKYKNAFVGDLNADTISLYYGEIQRFSDLHRKGKEFHNFKLNTVAQSYDIHDIIFFYSFLEYFCSKSISEQDIRELIHIKESQIIDLNSQIKFFTGNT